MKFKSEVSLIFPIFHNCICTQFRAKIHTFRSNNGKEYFNQDPITQTNCVNTPQQNRTAKRKKYTLEVAQSLLFQIRVPKTY